MLDPDAEAIRQMAAAATEWVVDYLTSVRELPVAPAGSAADLRDALAEPVPADGRDFASILNATCRPGAARPAVKMERLTADASGDLSVEVRAARLA